MTANHLLRQIPLTVSPYIHIPIAVTLPYSYQSLPRGLPPSSTEALPIPNITTDIQRSNEFIKSPSGHIITTPDEISGNCHDLIQLLKNQQMAADRIVSEWEQSIEQRDLIEKRKLAPGYLDTGLRILEPTRRLKNSEVDVYKAKSDKSENKSTGEELDRVFGKCTN